MIYLRVSRSVYGYAIGTALRGFSNDKQILEGIYEIAETCDLCPDMLAFNVCIHPGMPFEKIQEFCVLAQLQGYHIEEKDFLSA